MWQLIDNTGNGKGYLRILKDGERVADLFPFAPGSDANFITSQGQRIVDTMNQMDMVASGSSELPPLGESTPIAFSEAKKERDAGWPNR